MASNTTGALMDAIIIISCFFMQTIIVPNLIKSFNNNHDDNSGANNSVVLFTVAITNVMIYSGRQGNAELDAWHGKSHLFCLKSPGMHALPHPTGKRAAPPHGEKGCPAPRGKGLPHPTGKRAAPPHWEKGCLTPRGKGLPHPASP